MVSHWAVNKYLELEFINITDRKMIDNPPCKKEVRFVIMSCYQSL